MEGERLTGPSTTAINSKQPEPDLNSQPLLMASLSRAPVEGEHLIGPSTTAINSKQPEPDLGSQPLLMASRSPSPHGSAAVVPFGVYLPMPKLSPICSPASASTSIPPPKCSTRAGPSTLSCHDSNKENEFPLENHCMFCSQH